MKRFVWPYQRLLDIKDKQEQAIRGELIVLTEKAAGIRGRVMMLNMLLRSALAELKDRQKKRGIGPQADFMRHVHVKDAEISRLNQELAQVEHDRNEKLNALMELQKTRKTLEKLRVKALAEYHVQVNRDEQNALDENISTTYARAILAEL